jgi:hypothetical protein
MDDPQAAQQVIEGFMEEETPQYEPPEEDFDAKVNEALKRTKKVKNWIHYDDHL